MKIAGLNQKSVQMFPIQNILIHPFTELSYELQMLEEAKTEHVVGYSLYLCKEIVVRRNEIASKLQAHKITTIRIIFSDY